MSRYTKNNPGGHVLTAFEKNLLKNVYGTKEQRIGVDSQKKFEQCFLCLQKLQQPMCCQKGHLFCKDCIMLNLIEQKKKIKQQHEDWLLKQQKDAMVQLENKKLQKQELQENFEKMEYFVETDKKINESQSQQQINENELKNKQEITKIQENKQRLKNMTKKEMSKESFWLPESKTNEENKLNIEKPNNKLICPVRHQDKDHEIKVKKLYPANILEIDNEFLCHICQKQLQFQKISMLRKCGHVMCRECLKTICSKEKQCGVCMKIFNENDIIEIQEGLSGFTSHNSVEVKVYTAAFKG